MAELLGKVENILEPHLGIVVYIADHRHYVIAALEHFCYGTPMPVDDNPGYWLPTEVLQRLRVEVFRAMASAIQVGFNIIWPACHYSFYVMGDDVIIEETPHAMPVAEPLPEDDGRNDYIPERLRR